MKTKKNYIASTYSELQAIPELEKAVGEFETEKCSTWGLIKLGFQTIEICVENLNDLFSRIPNDLLSSDLNEVLRKISWISDITLLANRLGQLSRLSTHENLAFTGSQSVEIQSFVELKNLYRNFDFLVFDYLNSRSITAQDVFESRVQSRELFCLLNNYRVLAHDLALLDKSVQRLPLPPDVAYDKFIGLEYIKSAVDNPSLEGDTFFKQFRCLHQVPELLTFEVNDRIVYSIECLKKGDNRSVHHHLRIANEIMLMTVECMRPIIDNLTLEDYHKIRESLGLTSGSHSTSIHHQLFRTLYVELASEYVSRYAIHRSEYLEKVKNDYILKLVEVELLRLRDSIGRWRDMHLHLPKTNLGENKTKSLIGANDAVEAVKRMQVVAMERDPLSVVESFYTSSVLAEHWYLKPYINSEESLNHYIGDSIGAITQKRFPLVQNREGIFSQSIVNKNPKDSI